MKVYAGVDKDSILIHMAMRRSSTAMPDTRALPSDLKWQTSQRNSGWQCDRTNAGFCRMRLRGMAKNCCIINVLAALLNLFLARCSLLLAK